MLTDLPKRAYQCLSPPHWPADVDKAFRDKLYTGKWKDPPRVQVFERGLAARLGCPPSWVLATSSCTSALGVACTLFESELPRDDTGRPRVRVSPLTYPATYCWAINLGWTIDWVDVNEDGWPAGPVDIGVDLWGRSFPEECLILDAAHRVLDLGHIERLRQGHCKAVAYSFGPNKEVPCVEGGALVAPSLESPEWRAQAEALISSGQGRPLLGGWKGYMSTPAAAAIGRQLVHHRKFHGRRQKLLGYYQHWMGSALLTPPGASGHLCVAALPTPGHAIAARRRLEKLHIDCSLHYPIPEVPCPGAHELVKSLVTLPLHPRMGKHDVLLVSRNVQTAL